MYMHAYIQVERDWHCFHCQIEDNICNGTETPDACKFQGCKVGISLCQQVDVCALWYGRGEKHLCY